MGVSLFGKGREKILEFFYNTKGKEAYFSEILRNTHLTQNTTLKHLQLLEQNKIIIKNKKIGNTFYSLNPNNNQVFSLMSYLDFKRFNALDSGKKGIIEAQLVHMEKSAASVTKSENKNEKEKSGGTNFIPLIALVFFIKKTINLLMVNTLQKEDKLVSSSNNLTTYTITYTYFQDQILKKTDPLINQAVQLGIVIRGHDLFYSNILPKIER